MNTTLHTLADARAFILNEPQQIQERPTWRQTAQLLIEAAEDGRRIEVATKQIELALFLEGVSRSAALTIETSRMCRKNDDLIPFTRELVAAIN